jgi:uncharacterized protein (DUF4415 family)
VKKDKNIKSYSAKELEAMRARGESRTDWNKVDAMSDGELERLIAENEDERGFKPDWTRARIVLPEPKRSIHLRLERDIIEFFKARGKGHITRMQAVLRAYVDAHKGECRP